MSATPQAFIPSQNYEKTAMARARARLGKMTGVCLNTPMDEVRLTQTGVSITIYSESLKQLGRNSSDLNWVIKPRTLTHRKAKKEPLTQEESGRWLRAAKTQALADEVFGSVEKASIWLHKARKKFGGQSAVELIQTEAGAQLVEDTLNQIDSGYLA